MQTHICFCKHPQQSHKDIGSDPNKGWGQGECSICRCKQYICKECYENKQPRPVLPPNSAMLKPGTLKFGVYAKEPTLSEYIYYRR